MRDSNGKEDKPVRASTRRAAGKRLLPTAALLAVLLPAASRAEVLQDTVATVDGQPVMLTEYKKNVEAVMENYRRSSPMLLTDKEAVSQIKKKVLEDMINEALLAQEGERRKIKIHEREVDNGVAQFKEQNLRVNNEGKRLSDEEVEKALNDGLRQEGLTQSQYRDRIRRRLLIERVLEESVRSKVKPAAEADVKKSFEKLKLIVKGDTTAVQGMPAEDAEAFLALGRRVRDLTAERVRVLSILFKFPAGASLVEKTAALKKAQDVKKQLDAGEDFAELAKKSSEDRESAERGGDLGFILKGWMPPEFEKAAFSMPVGDVSDPIETQFGYHLIRVQEKKASENVTYDKLKDDISQFLANLEYQKELDKLAKGLRAQTHVEIKLPKDD